MISKMIKKITICLVAVLISSNAFSQGTPMDQNADQSQGNYVPMDMGYAGFNSIGMLQSAWTDPLQNLGEGQSKPAYSKYYWSPDLVLPIRLREGMMTLINFPSWELIEDIYIGDHATFDGQISGPNTILLYPKKGANVGVDTNIILFGRSGNRYVFYVKSEGVNTERITNSIIDIEVIDSPSDVESARRGGGIAGGPGGTNASKYYGGPKGSMDSRFTKSFQKADWIKNVPLDPTKFRFDIEIYVPNPEDVVIAPERVWRDDIFTYIDLGEKALNMTQRPIVTLIVERVEVPIGFRTDGPNNRLIIVEGIGDMVLRNGKRIICLKLRRSDSKGLDMQTYATDFQDNEWNVTAPLPSKGGNGSVGSNGFNTPVGIRCDGGNCGNAGDSFGGDRFGGGNRGHMGMNSNGSGSNYGAGVSGGGYNSSQMQTNSAGMNMGSSGAGMGGGMYGYGSGFTDSGSNISIELGTDSNVSKLESLWENLSGKYSDVLSVYEPFYSVDTPADGQGKELFHLRVGPVKTLDEGDSACSKLGRNGIFCSVVRTQ